MERARVASEVALPTMISTRGIFSAGEKKCRPMKLAGRTLASARPVIGRVEVLEAKMASAAITASVFLVTSALISRFSNTASITSSQPFRSA
jgi:hypothetical protein